MIKDFKTIVYLLFILFLLNSCTEKNTPKDQMDYEDLIILFMQDMNDEASGLSWVTGAQNESPINWQDSGLAECDKFSDYQLPSLFCRRGQLVLTESKKPIAEYLDRHVKPLPWKITLLGNINMANLLLIESNFTDTVLPLEKSKKLNIKPYRCKNEFGQSGNKIFYLSYAKKKPVYLNEIKFCGNHCLIIYIIYLSKEEADSFICLQH